MTFDEIMAKLKALGKAHTAKLYRRHGTGDNVFGVSFAEIGKLKKKIKTDHDLALQLWDSGSLDARILAAMIADPDKCKIGLLERLLGETEFYGLVDSVAGVVDFSSMPDHLVSMSRASAATFQSPVSGLLSSGSIH